MVRFAWFGVWPLLLLQRIEHLLEILPELLNGDWFVRDGRGRSRKQKKLLQGARGDGEFRAVRLHVLLEPLGRSRESEDGQITLKDRLNDGRDQVRRTLETTDHSKATELLVIMLRDVKR
jgi:hypothetical protein